MQCFYYFCRLSYHSSNIPGCKLYAVWNIRSILPSPRASLRTSVTFVMMGTPSCSLAGFPTILFVIEDGVAHEALRLMPPISFVFLVEQRGISAKFFCGWMPFLLPTSRNRSLDLIFSLTTKTDKQGKGHHSIYTGCPTLEPHVKK